MKKTLVALAAFASVSAFAQSAVTISGIVNYGLSNPTSYGASTSQNMAFGGLKGDRNKLSFDVTEDMGGGLSTIAKLEARFQLQSGQTGYASGAATPLAAAGTTLFEQTMIGIKSAQFGTVKFGRFTNAIGTYDFSVFEDSKYGTNASQASYGRHNAQVQYDSPTISGFTLSAVSANYRYNGWGQGTTGWGFADGVDYATYSATGLSSLGAGLVTYSNGPLVAQYAKIQGLFNDKATRIGANYTLASSMKLYGGFYNQQGAVGTIFQALSTANSVNGSIPKTAAVAKTGMAEHSATELGLMIPVGQWNLRAGWVRNSKDIEVGTTNGDTKAEKISYGAEYNLSKRTMIIAQKGSVKNGVSFASAASSTSISGGGFGYTQGTMSFVGLQHSF